jgi:hypothetical protein
MLPPVTEAMVVFLSEGKSLFPKAALTVATVGAAVMSFSW